MRSRKHRWLERIVAFGGLGYWLITTYVALAFAAALLTTLTSLSWLRVLLVLLLVLAAFAALAAHRWQPRLAQMAHWTMVLVTVATIGTCSEFVEFPPSYQTVLYRGVAIEFADPGVGQAMGQIRDVIDQVYARSQLAEPQPRLRMRFVHDGAGGTLRLGDWSDAGGGDAEIVLTTSGGTTRGQSFLLESSFLLAEALARRAQPSARRGPLNGFAYWTMLGVRPQPDWAATFLANGTREQCARLPRASLEMGTSGELTIWYPDSQLALHFDVGPFIEAERSAGNPAAWSLFSDAAKWTESQWASEVARFCTR